MSINFNKDIKKPYIEELALSGACHRGIMYIGAFHYLEEIELLNKAYLKRVVGTSIGSFILSCYLSGYTINDLINMVLDVQFEIFKDWSLQTGLSLINLFEGNVFRKWVIKCLSKYVPRNITMEEFYKKTGIDFTITTVSLETGLLYISHKTRPLMILHDAVIASMNIPFLFPPYETSDGYLKDIYVDGGLLDNFSIHLLGPKAFGLVPTRQQITEITEITNPFSYFIKMSELISSMVKNLRRPKSNYIVEIYDTSSDFIDFDLNKDDKITMYKLGYNTLKNSTIVEKFIKDFYHENFKNVLEQLIYENILNKYYKILKDMRLINLELNFN